MIVGPYLSRDMSSVLAIRFDHAFGVRRSFLLQQFLSIWINFFLELFHRGGGLHDVGICKGETLALWYLPTLYTTIFLLSRS